MKHNNSIVHTIVIKLLFIVGLSVCIVTTVFSNTTKQLEDIQTPQKSFSPLLLYDLSHCSSKMFCFGLPSINYHFL